MIALIPKYYCTRYLREAEGVGGRQGGAYPLFQDLAHNRRTTDRTAVVFEKTILTFVFACLRTTSVPSDGMSVDGRHPTCPAERNINICTLWMGAAYAMESDLDTTRPERIPPIY